ncbi:MAG TPA: response regulator [Cytophagales bacterium]|nr:response regulator [Cytophagales bacterium]
MIKLKTIILIDDDEVAISLNETVIRSLDCCVNLEVFPNAVQGLNYFRALCEEDECPELILVDLSMPIIDGFEFIKEFESFYPQLRKRAKIILLTTSNRREDLANSRVLGFDDYIVKPLTFDKVNKVLAEHFSNTSTKFISDFRK